MTTSVKRLVANEIVKDWLNTPKTLPIDAVAIEADCATELLQEVMMVADEVLTEEDNYEWMMKLGKQIHDQIVEQLDRQFLDRAFSLPRGIV